MIRGYIATAIFSALISSALTWLWVRRPRPVMPHKHRVLLAEAMALLHQLLHPSSLDRPELLSDQSKETASSLLARYEKEVLDK